MNIELFNLISTEKNPTKFLKDIDSILLRNDTKRDAITPDLIDNDFIKEIKELPPEKVEFGKSLRDLKCIISDEEGLREHVVFLKYIEPHRLVVSSVNLPYSCLQDKEYISLKEVVTAFKCYIAKLDSYLYELECIDNHCTVVEPAEPTFKDEFRRIALDDRTWLHVEVTHEGVASNVHLIGQSEKWQDKLQAGLLKWDHDKNIYENITNIFDLSNTSLSLRNTNYETIPGKENESEITCGICFCTELPDKPGMPQPICQNLNCGVYFHKFCIFQWLIACDGGRPPAFGVANGSCPTCLQPIACSEKDT